jgi:SNF2 family DNA or RNA helicase
VKKDNAPKDKKSLDPFDLVITTYALIQRHEWLQSYSWNYIILDEAQAIKNPGTKQARAIKNLTACNRIIMTGTPSIQNWSEEECCCSQVFDKRYCGRED